MTWYRSFVTIAMSVGFKVNAIYVGKANMGLTFVPQDISINVTYLNNGDNKIIRVMNMSFPLFKKLYRLQISRNGLTYIENGAFDHNAKLEHIMAGVNTIMQLPHKFENDWFYSAQYATQL